MSSTKVLFWRGLLCSLEAQDGEEMGEEERERARVGGEAGAFSFSIMVVLLLFFLSVFISVSKCSAVFMFVLD